MSIYGARMRCAAVVGSAAQSAMAKFYAQGG